MKIALAMNWLNDGSVKNVVGDALVADAWAKYLRRRDDVEEVRIVSPKDGNSIYETDVVIHFWHVPGMLMHPTAKNLLYLQNALGAEFHPEGTVGVFKSVADRFDGYIYPSETLKANCGRDGLVLPFAADPEVFTYQPDDRFAHPVAFCGNDIRPAEVNERYLVPALAHGLVIYSGGVWRDPRLQAVNRGRISGEDLPKLYSSARVVLNITHPEHVKNRVVNSRIYEVLACGGKLVSDTVPDGEFDEHVESYDVFFRDENVAVMDTLRPIDHPKRSCRDFILAKHAFAHRMADLMQFLKEVV